MEFFWADNFSYRFSYKAFKLLNKLLTCPYKKISNSFCKIISKLQQKSFNSIFFSKFLPCLKMSLVFFLLLIIPFFRVDANFSISNSKSNQNPLFPYSRFRFCNFISKKFKNFSIFSLHFSAKHTKNTWQCDTLLKEKMVSRQIL